jgi:hypothetical protein
MQLFLKFSILIIFVAVLLSLGSAMFSLMRHKPGSRRLANSLTVRICLSILLFLLLLVAYYTGAIQPHGLLSYSQ